MGLVATILDGANIIVSLQSSTEHHQCKEVHISGPSTTLKVAFWKSVRAFSVFTMIAQNNLVQWIIVIFSHIFSLSCIIFKQTKKTIYNYLNLCLTFVKYGAKVVLIHTLFSRMHLPCESTYFVNSLTVLGVQKITS